MPDLPIHTTTEAATTPNTNTNTTTPFPAHRLEHIRNVCKHLVKHSQDNITLDINPSDGSDPDDEPKSRKWKTFAEHKATSPAKGDDVSIKLAARLGGYQDGDPDGFPMEDYRNSVLACLRSVDADDFEEWDGEWVAGTSFLWHLVDLALPGEQEYVLELRITVKFLGRTA